MNITDIFSEIYTNTKSSIVSIPSYAGSIFEFRQVPGFPISWLEVILILISCVVLAFVVLGRPFSNSTLTTSTSNTIMGGFRRKR